MWKISPDLFESKSVLEFLNKFDTHCRNRIEFVICNFCTHDETVVSDSDLDGFIAEAPKVFGDFWKLLCDLRGIKLKVKKSQHLIQSKRREVFFSILTLARIAHRRLLLHWALIQNLSNYARGVGPNAESAIAIFGSSSVSVATRKRILSKLSGNIRERRN